MKKDTFKILFASCAVILVLLPPLAALNSLLTETLNNAGWYKPIQDFIVPQEARFVAATINFVGIQTKLTPETTVSAMYMIKDGAILPVDLQWNCLGWQSALLLIVSLIAGLRGNFTHLSRIKCILFGILGTLLVNIFRMSFIAIGVYYINSLFAMIIHDYFAAFISLIWLFFFWWFSYSFVLEEKSMVINTVLKKNS